MRRPPVGTVVREGEVASDVRVVPKHVYEANLLNNVSTEVPAGYRLAFDDGRLNTRRAEMTFAGKAQSDAIWERKVPRRMLTGIAVPVVVARDASVETPLAPAPVVSSRSAPAEKSLRLSGTTYVQVATFTEASAAQGTAKQVRKLGMPVRIGKYERAGTEHRMVLAGPFADQAAAEKALLKARSAGYSDAFLRK
ncbi:SPOR domain-containing protein [Shimia isoporae]|uniref:SPOR domain-containing protein n=1 Tax=Shimia isoporae TaxID=647720 RepID=UPI001405024D|nr:SPOR domain-containing protein [Shimia isoporae]